MGKFSSTCLYMAHKYSTARMKTHDTTRKYPHFMHESWYEMFEYRHFVELASKLPRENISPSFMPAIFKAFSMPRDQVKAVVIGQDPYPDPKLATGIAFAVPINAKIPPSLNAIWQSIEDYQGTVRRDPEMDHWIDQGILLLNTALTCEAGKPGTHYDIWRPFMRRVINELILSDNLIWYLMGKVAKEEFLPLFNLSNSYVLTGNHPAVVVYDGVFESKFKQLSDRYEHVYGNKLIF